jgi:hypothetical protein
MMIRSAQEQTNYVTVLEVPIAEKNEAELLGAW